MFIADFSKDDRTQNCNKMSVLHFQQYEYCTLKTPEGSHLANLFGSRSIIKDDSYMYLITKYSNHNDKEAKYLILWFLHKPTTANDNGVVYSAQYHFSILYQIIRIPLDTICRIMYSMQKFTHSK